MSTTQVYLSPGLFGFAELAGLNYMAHVQKAIEQRYRERGRLAEVRVAGVHPSASIRRRAAQLVRLINETAQADGGPIHLLGHSMGGLDVRLTASPSAKLDPEATEGEGSGNRPWLDRLRSITTLNTPHYGSPGGAFFTTTQGQRLLYGVSALTLASMRLGSPPLTVTSALVATLGRAHQRANFELRLIDRIVEALERTLDTDAREEVRDWLRKIRDDQGALAQLMPEAMDLFQAGVEDKPGLRYQCVATYTPPRRASRMLRDVSRPWLPLSAALFHLLYRVAAAQNPRYPYAPPDGGYQTLGAALGEVPAPDANDGMVPLRSQLWGTLVWAGKADHLDVVGHFDEPPDHHDWLCSGAHFDRAHFDAMMDRVVEGMLLGEAEGD
jgi:triacylglycerol lipase